MVVKLNATCQQIAKEEGFETHVYKCSRGFDTIGRGYNLDANPLNLTAFEIKEFRHNGISEDAANLLLIRYVEEIEGDLSESIAVFDELNEARKSVLVSMAYQMGINGVMKFKGMLTAIKHSEYDLAAKEMLDSVWAHQTPNRARRLAQQMKTGEYA